MKIIITRIVTRWPEATATKFSSDQATEFGYEGEATSEAAWKRSAIIMSELSREFGLGLEMELIWRENQEIQKSKMIVEIISKIKNPSSNPLLCASSSAKLFQSY